MWVEGAGWYTIRLTKTHPRVLTHAGVFRTPLPTQSRVGLWCTFHVLAPRRSHRTQLLSTPTPAQPPQPTQPHSTSARPSLPPLPILTSTAGGDLNDDFSGVYFKRACAHAGAVGMMGESSVVLGPGAVPDHL